MRKYIIEISYDGSKYNGLQKLKGSRTIQGELEEVLTKLNEKPVKVLASGRTDKGVHAKMQVCTFTLDKDINPYRLRYYIDRSTSPYLFIKHCDYMNDEYFHPRFSVKSKTYKYIINIGIYDAIQNDYVYNFNKELDVSQMKDAAKLFLGYHNFKAFIVGRHKNYETLIEDIDIKFLNDNVIITIKGLAFYTYMVRCIVKILILIGTHTISKDKVLKMLNTGKKLIEYSPVPANGLYLEKIEY